MVSQRHWLSNKKASFYEINKNKKGTKHTFTRKLEFPASQNSRNN